MSERVAHPSMAALGWLEPGGNKKDAIEYAKGWAMKHMDAPNVSWFAVMPFMNGFIWEVHEGGPGLSYLPATAKALADPSGRAGWFRAGQKVIQARMRDGRPFITTLPTEASRPIILANENPMVPKGQMQRVVKTGAKVLAFGATVFGTGAVFFALACVYSYLVMGYAPDARRIEPDMVAHRQWTRVERIPPNLYVESMKYENKQWTANIKPILRNSRGGAVGSPPPATPAASTQPAPQPRTVAPLPAPAPVAPVTPPAARTAP